MRKTLLRRIGVLAAVLIIMLCSLAGCGGEKTTSEEAEREAKDVAMMDEAENYGITLMVSEEEADLALQNQFYNEGVWYDPEEKHLVAEKPEKAYGCGTEEDGGEVWGYYCGVKNGNPVKAFYDSKKDYSNMVIKVQGDYEMETVYYNWVEIN